MDGHSIYFLSIHNGGDGFLCSCFQNLVLFDLFIALIESDVILSLPFNTERVRNQKRKATTDIL